MQRPRLWDCLTAVFEERWWADRQLDDFYRPERFPGLARSVHGADAVSRLPARPAVDGRSSNATVDQGPQLKRVGEHPRPVLAFWGKEDHRRAARVQRHAARGDAARPSGDGRIGRPSAALGAAGHRPSGVDRVSPPMTLTSLMTERPTRETRRGSVSSVEIASLADSPSLARRGAAWRSRSRRVRARRRFSSTPRGHAADPAQRPGVLEARRGPVRAERQLPVRQPAVERAAVSARHPELTRVAQAGTRVSRRRPGTELHLHRRAQAVDRVHRRHPPRQSGSPSPLQGALRAVGGPRASSSSLLFSRPRPRGPDARSRRPSEIFDAYATVEPSERLYVENDVVGARIGCSRRIASSCPRTICAESSTSTARSSMFGPGIKYSPIGLDGGTIQPTYAALMAATDERGQARGFLATEDAFAFREGPAEPQSDRAGRRQFRRPQGDSRRRRPI